MSPRVYLTAADNGDGALRPWEGDMKTPNIGDEYEGSREAGTLGRSIVWRVTKLANKAGWDYVELQAVDEQLERKILSARALSDGRLFSRVGKA